jgi:Ca2+-binding RTX toxin-like protein
VCSSDLDTLNGGGGNDTASYFLSSIGVDVDLNAASQRYGDADGDVLNNIFNLRGSRFDDDLTGLYSVGIGGYSDNSIWGEDGNDAILDVLGHNSLYGGAGDDTLTGGDEGSLLAGGAGNDQLRAGVSNPIGGDTLCGGLGDDTYTVSDLQDVVSENHLGEIAVGADGGHDVVISNVFFLTLNTALRADIEDLTIGSGQNGNGNALANTITGSDLANTLQGLGGHDTVYGGAGNDVILGGLGNDSLVGDAGSDSLNGNEGNDVLVGGGGADKFVFNVNFGNDVITDFEDGIDHVKLVGLASNFSELALTQIGKDVQISLAYQTIVMSDTALADLSSADFIFG